MRAEDVTDTIELALAASGCDQATVRHKPRLLSDNGLQQSTLPRELEQRHTRRRLLRTRQSHSARKGKDQETDNPTTPLAPRKPVIKPI